MPAPRLLEVCVDSIEGVACAERAGAGRVELCADLLEGGITPSSGCLEVALGRGIPVMVMVRPRAGDFLYSDSEFEVMRRDVDRAVALGARGVVLGLLAADGQIDAARTAELVERARPLQVTFHRAFDMARDPHEALDCLLEIGVDRLLTSGQRARVSEGVELIAELVQRAGDSLSVMPGGGITEASFSSILGATAAREFHVSARAARDSSMRFRNPKCVMGDDTLSEYQLQVTSEQRVREFVRILAAAADSQA